MFTRSSKQLLILIVSLFALGGTVAAAPEATNQTMAEHTTFFSTIVQFLAWSRSFFAIIAGKLMTNAMLTGEILQLDIHLWKLRNMTKTMANFGLGFAAIAAIAKFLIAGKEGAKELIGKVFKNLLIAGVLIQFSWFLVMVLIDISIILTTTVGSLPSVFISESEQAQEYTTQAGATSIQKQRFIVDMTDKNNQNWFTRDESYEGEVLNQDQFFDSIMPQNNNVAGPLLFLGASIFRMHEHTLYDPDTRQSGKAAFITILLNAGVMILYAIALLTLVVVNVVRVGFVWLMMAASPILILLRGLKEMGVVEKDLLGDMLSFKTLFELLMIPVRVVFFLGILLMLVVGMRSIMLDTDGITQSTQELYNTYDVDLTSDEQQNEFRIDNVAHTTLKGNIFQDVTTTTQNTLADLIVFIATFVLVRILIKLSFPKDNAITGKITEKITGFAEQVMRDTPLIPIPGKGKLAISDLGRAGRTLRDQAIQAKVPGARGLHDLDRTGKDAMDTFLSDKFGIARSNLTANELSKVKKAVSKDQIDDDRFLQTAASIGPELAGGFSFGDTKRKEHTYNWIKNRPDKKITLKMADKTYDIKVPDTFGTDPTKADADLQTFFDQKTGGLSNAQILHNYLTTNTNLREANNRKNVDNYATLKGLTYRG